MLGINTRAIAYDNSAGGLSKAWWAGAEAQQFLRNFDVVLKVNSWDELHESIHALPAHVRFSNFQLWGHGRKGAPLIANIAMWRDDFAKAMSGRLWRSSNVWFRSCDTFGGESGIFFAKEMVRRLQCRVTGHTRIVSWPFPICQSGGYTLTPDALDVHWTATDGRKPNGSSKGSFPLVKNTCTIFTMDPPEHWSR